MVQEMRKRINEEWTLNIAKNFYKNKKTLEGSKRGNKGGERFVVSEKPDR